jgi:hypothetical protein
MRNEGTWDRVVRVVIGAALLIAWAAGAFTGAWAAVLGIVGLLLTATGIVGFCPAYRLLGISTCPVPAKRR